MFSVHLMMKANGRDRQNCVSGHSLSAGIPASCLAALVLAWTTGLLTAQTGTVPASLATADSSAPASRPLTGPQIVSASIYGAYYSSSVPETGTAVYTNSANLPADVGAGGSIFFNWVKFTERTTFSLSYTPSYVAQVRNTSLDSLNHAFSLNATQKLDPRWSLGFSVAANYSTLEESLFAPDTLSNVASVPSNFNEFSSALLSGNFSNNPQLGVILTNSPLVESPLATLLYGQRIFTSSAHGSLSYSVSPRLSLSFNGGGGYTQYFSGNQVSVGGAPPLLQNTTSGNASLALSYSLSPVSQFGGTVATYLVSSPLEDAYTTTSQATYGRTLASHWTMQLHAGVGFNNPLKTYYVGTNYVSATGPRPVAGGSLGFKTGNQTLLGSFDRTVNDSYGLGTSTSSTSTAAWRWRRPQSRWSLQCSFSWQQLQGGALTNTSGWRATGTVGRAFGTHLAGLWQYTYLTYSGGLQTSAYSLNESAVRFSLVWTAQPNRL